MVLLFMFANSGCVLPLWI